MAKNKIKTCRGAAKRFKITAKGKVKRKKAFLRHQLSCKSATQKRNLRAHGLVDASNISSVKKMLPSSF